MAKTTEVTVSLVGTEEWKKLVDLMAEVYNAAVDLLKDCDCEGSEFLEAAIGHVDDWIEDRT